eukprot:525415-Pleurochrysis_carterae.AAC.5
MPRPVTSTSQESIYHSYDRRPAGRAVRLPGLASCSKTAQQHERQDSDAAERARERAPAHPASSTFALSTVPAPQNVAHRVRPDAHRQHLQAHLGGEEQQTDTLREQGKTMRAIQTRGFQPTVID